MSRAVSASRLLSLSLAFIALLCPAIALALEPAQDPSPVFLPVIGLSSTAFASPVASATYSEAEQKAALAYWSDSRVAVTAASPLMISVESEKIEALEVDAASVPGFSPAGRASAGADSVAQALYASAWVASETTDAEMAALDDEAMIGAAASPYAIDGTSQIYNSYIANLISTMQTPYPHRWVGKLTFRNNGADYVCTATAIRGNNIVTAAHCLYDTANRNVWHTNIVFRPAYRLGSSPYGAFTATGCSVPSAWVSLSGTYQYNTWARWDVGVCTVGANSAGQSLNTAVGFSGLAWDYPYDRNVNMMGYPSFNVDNIPLASPGEYLRLCAAESFAQATDVRGMGCNWGGGISGGPWLDSTSLNSPAAYGRNGYAPGRDTGYVTGVNSGFTASQQNMYAGRFTSQNIVPLCTLRGC